MNENRLYKDKKDIFGGWNSKDDDYEKRIESNWQVRIASIWSSP